VAQIKAIREILVKTAGSIREVFRYDGATIVADLKAHSASNLDAANRETGASFGPVLNTVHNETDVPLATQRV
jgi:hypothetical protein